MRCPVCLDAIDDVEPAFGDYSTINCNTCGNFEITGSALNELVGKSAAERAEALALAKREMSQGELPRITTRVFSPG